MRLQIRERPQSKRLRSIKSARQSVGEQAEIYFKRGKEYQASEKYRDGLDCYIKATICDEEYFQAYCNMGSCYRALCKYS